jgi:hypothetical protein
LSDQLNLVALTDKRRRFLKERVPEQFIGNVGVPIGIARDADRCR